MPETELVGSLFDLPIEIFSLAVEPEARVAAQEGADGALEALIEHRAENTNVLDESARRCVKILCC